MAAAIFVCSSAVKVRERGAPEQVVRAYRHVDCPFPLEAAFKGWGLSTTKFSSGARRSEVNCEAGGL